MVTIEPGAAASDDARHFSVESYDTKERFVSYWHQINEIIKLRPSSVLEIGVGSKFTSTYLKNKGCNIVTLDISRDLGPDYVGSVLSLPFRDNSFDVVCCFEVLEHLPYSDFTKAVSEIFRVSAKGAVLSLPDATRHFRFLFKIPHMKHPIEFLLPFPRVRKHIHTFDGEHYWEIGKKGYPLEKITGDMQNVGFTLEKTYRVFELPYHRFFILTKP